MKIFNKDGNDDKRSIIKGNPTGLFNLNDVKYQWTTGLYNLMVGNFWVPEKVSGLNDDAKMYNELSEAERKAYKGILSFLIFLDSIQTVNIPNISDYITAPEVKMLLAIQSYQELIHSKSYATILESVVNSDDRQSIYYFWRDDKVLLARNEYIGNIYQEFIDKPTDENFFKVLVANYLLEGVYFYNGFAFFDTLNDMGKMPATERMIAYIRRDEASHLSLFVGILKELKREFPKIYNETIILKMMLEAVKQEIEWTQHIIGNGVSGISNDTTESYTQWLANERLASLGIQPLFLDTKNPYKHLDKYQDPNTDKANFFETTVINYTQSSGLNGSWDF